MKTKNVIHKHSDHFGRLVFSLNHLRCHYFGNFLFLRGLCLCYLIRDKLCIHFKPNKYFIFTNTFHRKGLKIFAKISPQTS